MPAATSRRLALPLSSCCDQNARPPDSAGRPSRAWYAVATNAWLKDAAITVRVSRASRRRRVGGGGDDSTGGRGAHVPHPAASLDTVVPREFDWLLRALLLR